MNTPTITKNAHQLRKGDIVRYYGGRFLVTTDPRESQGHRPEGYWPQAGIGPSDCTSVQAVVLDGAVEGYFHPGSDWTFQGNTRATFAVEA